MKTWSFRLDVSEPSVAGTSSHAWVECGNLWAIGKAENGPLRHFFVSRFAGGGWTLDARRVHFRMWLGTRYAGGGVKRSEEKVDFGEKLNWL